MDIGIPTEVKAGEARVGLAPGAVAELVAAGHRLRVQAGAGMGSGFSDEEYRRAGATLVEAASEAWAAELVVKVKEPQREEVPFMREGQMLFTYLHLAAIPALAREILDTGVTAIAYETVTGKGGELPLLTPMSEVAGRLSIQAGCYHLQSTQGGRGLLLGGVPGVPPAEVVVIGGGVVGLQAARMAQALGARVTVFDTSLPRLRYLDTIFRGQVVCEFALRDSLLARVEKADLVVGAVLVPGAAAPRLLQREDVARMRPDSVLVDVAIDQGGCFATSHPTTHENPVYREEGVIHYCVANIPSAVARTSTAALTHATLPYVAALAEQGRGRLLEDPHLAAGVNLHAGAVTHKAVAAAVDLPFRALEQTL